jgi:hypothetical protein
MAIITNINTVDESTVYEELHNNKSELNQAMQCSAT